MNINLSLACLLIHLSLIFLFICFFQCYNFNKRTLFFESLVVAYELHPIDYREPEWFIRIYCGLEEPEDLIADIAQAITELR